MTLTIKNIGANMSNNEFDTVDYILIGVMILLVLAIFTIPLWSQTELSSAKPITLQFKHDNPSDVFLYTFNFYNLKDSLVYPKDIAAFRFTLTNDTLRYTTPASDSKSIPVGLGYAVATATDSAGNTSGESNKAFYRMLFPAPFELIITQ